jgi:hypothetical protein
VASPIIVRQQDHERQKVSSESSLKRIQTETNRHISSLSAIFENQGKAYRQLEQVSAELMGTELMGCVFFMMKLMSSPTKTAVQYTEVSGA